MDLIDEATHSTNTSEGEEGLLVSTTEPMNLRKITKKILHKPGRKGFQQKLVMKVAGEYSRNYW
jgi:hypothetical protein